MAPKVQWVRITSVLTWVLLYQAAGSSGGMLTLVETGHGNTRDHVTRIEMSPGVKDPLTLGDGKVDHRQHDFGELQTRPTYSEYEGIETFAVNELQLRPSYSEYEGIDTLGIDKLDDIDEFNKEGSQQTRDNIQMGKSIREILSGVSQQNTRNTYDWRKCILPTCHFRNMRLIAVPTDLPPDITGLDLSNNSISSLAKPSLCAYPSLLILLLEYNKLRHLDNDSFECMTKLTYLNLRGNHLETRKDNRNLAFPDGVFRPLSSLLVLKLNKNMRAYLPDYDYPGIQLADLKNLRALYLDGLSRASFGPNFGDMVSLRALDLSGYDEGFCDLSHVRKDFFQHVSQIRLLNIRDCKIKGSYFTEDLLRPLTKLIGLDISFNPIDTMAYLKHAFMGINDSNISVLVLNDIFSRYKRAVVVKKDVVKMLPRNLRYLEARENCFETLEPGVIEKLPKALKYIDVGSNKFIYSKYFLNLSVLENLETLMLNGGGFLRRFPSASLPRFRRSRLAKFPLLEGGKLTKETPIVFILPPKLDYVDMSIAGFKYFLSRINMSSKNALRYLKLGSNYFPRVNGPFIGFENVVFMDLSKASIEYFGENFFQKFTSLEHLRLASNKLGVWLDNKKYREPFSGLKNLMILDLSNTQILHLGRYVFKGLDKVEKLLLNMNKISDFDNPIADMDNLKYLSLRDNELGTLPLEVRKQIDRLISRKKVVRVDLSYNPIRCECSNLEFLRWMVQSDAFDKKFTNYGCRDSEAPFKFVHDAYAETIHTLRRQCYDNYFVFLAVLVVTLFMIGVVCCGIIYRFRWKLRYLYYAAYLRLKTKDLHQHLEQYRYDVFVSYTYKDEQFVLSELVPELLDRGLKLHVHGRDFVVGDFIASNIVTAIRESRKTLVVLTKDLLASKWCHYELQMANMESVHTGRQVLVFLLKESISPRELGSELTYHIRNSTYIQDPRSEGVVEEAVIEYFWNKLASDLKL